MVYFLFIEEEAELERKKETKRERKRKEGKKEGEKARKNITINKALGKLSFLHPITSVEIFADNEENDKTQTQILVQTEFLPRHYSLS